MTASAVPARPRPLVLAILDGFGERAERSANAIRLAKTPNLDALAAYPRTSLGAGGRDVGLGKGQPGGSEIGHHNLGAGRIASSDRARIDLSIADHTFRETEGIAEVLRIAKHHFNARLHLIGLLSDGGVHSSLLHLQAIIDAAHFEEVPVVVHAILDGRDAPERSAARYLTEIEHALDAGKKGIIGTLMGRSYAMDRGGHWDRVGLAFTAIVRGVAPRAETAAQALEAAYQRGKQDDEIEPIRVGEYSGMKGSFMCDFSGGDRAWRWFGEESALVWSLRGEPLRELVAMLHRRDVPAAIEQSAPLTDRGKEVFAFTKGVFATLTEQDPRLRVAFRREITEATLGEQLAAAGLTQLRCADTAKIEHVTTWLNGGREAPFDGEDRIVVESGGDAITYDRAPDTSAAALAQKVAEAIAAGRHDVIVVNLGNADLAAHAGRVESATRAVEAVDAALGVIVAAVRDAGGALVVTSDHGNCEAMKDERGRVHTGPTTNRVPLYYVNEADRAVTLREGGRLADVAPTLLSILGLSQPEVMTGRSLIVR